MNLIDFTRIIFFYRVSARSQWDTNQNILVLSNIQAQGFNPTSIQKIQNLIIELMERGENAWIEYQWLFICSLWSLPIQTFTIVTLCFYALWVDFINYAKVGSNLLILIKWHQVQATKPLNWFLTTITTKFRKQVLFN